MLKTLFKYAIVLEVLVVFLDTIRGANASIKYLLKTLEILSMVLQLMTPSG